MKAKSNKEIRESVRNEVARSFKEKVDTLKRDLKESRERIDELRKENYELRAEKERIEDENRQYKDWIDRLQEFCNMSEEDRQREIRIMQEKEANEKMQKEILSSPLFQMVSRYGFL